METDLRGFHTYFCCVGCVCEQYVFAEGRPQVETSSFSGIIQG